MHPQLKEGDTMKDTLDTLGWRQCSVLLMCTLAFSAAGCQSTDMRSKETKDTEQEGDADDLDGASLLDASDANDDTSDGDDESNSCHTDCFGGMSCQDGVVTRTEYGPKPCWAGEGCDTYEVGTCPDGCELDHIDEHQIPPGVVGGDSWMVMCNGFPADAGDTGDVGDTTDVADLADSHDTDH